MTRGPHFTFPTRQEGFEPPTNSLEGCRSIHLSYWRLPIATGHPAGHLATLPLPQPALPATSREQALHLRPHTPRASNSHASRFGPKQPIGAAGFEPATSCSQSRRDTGLRYAPYIRSRAVYPRGLIRSTAWRGLVHLLEKSTGGGLPEECLKRHSTMAHQSLLLTADLGKGAPPKRWR